MSFASFARDSIRLGNERIAPEDAQRQERAAAEVLRRFDRQPGIILADEVGMGKTFVALAVAASIILERKGSQPVVVMVPPTLKDKWPKDWGVFKEKCLGADADWIRASRALSGIDFLKLLDDPVDRQAHLIFLTHGALHRALTDGFARLAVIKRAFKGRSSLTAQRRAFPRFAPALLWLDWVERRAPGILGDLIEKPTENWLSMLHKANPLLRDRITDDPVPAGLQEALDAMESSIFEDLVDALRRIPLRESAYLEDRLRDTRHQIARVMETTWKSALSRIKFRSPLLILDEAHHVKNPATQLSSLFVDEDAAKESEYFGSSGALGGKFERMLFLTATPFQLGHAELVEVLRRFEGIDWKSKHPPALHRTEFNAEIAQLESSLTEAQSAALRLDRAWGKLPGDLHEVDGARPNIDEWWESVSRAHQEGAVGTAIEHVTETQAKMGVAEERLRPWVLRHRKAENLPNAPDVTRRRTYPGAAINDHDTEDAGLEIDGEILLPFLLAGRAQSLLAASRKGRALFAEGLASSFEAYLKTRAGKVELDDDVLPADVQDDSGLPELHWYLEHLDRSLPESDQRSWGRHPKVRATARRVVDLWKVGEKVLVFCHYRATGRALRAHISSLLQDEILRLGKHQFPALADHEVLQELEAVGDRFFDADGVLRREVTDALQGIVAPFTAAGVKGSLTHAEGERVVEIVRRFLRTPSFLVRYFDLSREDRDVAFREAIEREDIGGLSLRRRIEDFCRFLCECVSDEGAEIDERREYLSALESIQTGRQFGDNIGVEFDPAEGMADSRSTVLLPNVRLANGEVRSETRRKLLLTFNTPLFPEILIASSVLAEGVDLHRNCRFIIHHDLCWNPSTLEQRTGRIDRIGSKAEQARQPIHVYLPYVAATQDEKMYRVVRDRERWFQIIMGEKYAMDDGTEASTEKRAERLPLPQSVQKALTLKLGI